ncbi:MAG TPA: autotransporter-associated beta strand repeat-containing protein, partial [Humisphaera sp.]
MASSLGGSPALAAIVTWDFDTATTGAQDGGGTWTAGAVTFWNGTSNVATSNSLATDIAQFGSGGTLAAGTTVSVGTQSINGLIFGTTTTSGYTLSATTAGQILSIGGSGIVLNAGAQATTLGNTNLGITLGAAQSWTNDSTGLFTVAGAVTNGANLLTIGGAGNTTITGIIGGGAGGITKSGAGTLTLSGVNTYTGVSTLSSGILRATTSAQALGTGAATLSLGGGELQLANATGLTFGRNTTVTANTAITSDVLAAGAGVTHTLGTLSIGAQTLTINRGANATSGTGGITFGAATLTGAATFNTAANTLLTLSSTTALGANTLTKTGPGSMTLTGVVSGSAAVGTTAITVSDGVLTASGANTFTGDIAVSGSGVFAMAGATYTTTAPYGTVAGGTAYKQLLLTNGGTFRLLSGTFNDNLPTTTNIAAGIIFNIGTGGATFDVASGANLTIDDGSGTGTGVTSPGASQLQGSGTITKTGLGIFQQDDSTAFAGAIIIAAGTFQPATA